jgi:Predicted transcriptional regulator
MTATKNTAAKEPLTDIGALNHYQGEEPVSAENASTVGKPSIREDRASSEATPETRKRGRRSKNDDSVKMSPVGKYRSALGMTQADMARFLGTTPSTLNVWERDVAEEMEEKRGSSYFIYKCVKALINQSFKTPDMIAPADLKKFFQAGASQNLAKHYIPVSDFLDDEFMIIINSGNFIGVLFAMLADNYFRKTGKTVPGEQMLKMQNIEKEIIQKDATINEEYLEKLSTF